MQFELCELEDSLCAQCLEIFNAIIADGVNYPHEVLMSREDFDAFYQPGEPVWCAVDAENKVLGFVHVHPNGFGRLAHIANCGYAVAEDARGKGVGKALVAKSIEVCREMGFKGIQFNAVVATNVYAIRLYTSFGFEIIGTIPGGFRFGSAEEPKYVDRYIMYLEL